MYIRNVYFDKKRQFGEWYCVGDESIYSVNKNNPELLVRLIVVFLTTSILSEISASKMYHNELTFFSFSYCGFSQIQRIPKINYLN